MPDCRSIRDHLTTFSNHRNTPAMNDLTFVEHLKVGQWMFLEVNFAKSSCQKEYFHKDEVLFIQLLVSKDKW